MDLLQILTLAIVQGLTEFLPISSSAHLILSPYLFGFADQGLAFDVAVHLGSLFAVIAYLRHDLINITIDWFGSLVPGKPSSSNSHLGWAIIIGTLPVVIAGLSIKSLIEGDLRAPWIIGVTTIVFGLFLWWADANSRRERKLTDITLKDALIIGCFQVIALIPGTSRSGITMSAALLLGLTRKAASRFSFLLAVPTILASSIFVVKDLFESNEAVDWTSLGLGVLLSGITAYLAIHYFMQYIERIGMLPFVIYRLLLGVVIFVLIF